MERLLKKNDGGVSLSNQKERKNQTRPSEYFNYVCLGVCVWIKLTGDNLINDKIKWRDKDKDKDKDKGVTSCLQGLLSCLDIFKYRSFEITNRKRDLTRTNWSKN